MYLLNLQLLLVPEGNNRKTEVPQQGRLFGRSRGLGGRMALGLRPG